MRDKGDSVDWILKWYIYKSYFYLFILLIKQLNFDVIKLGI